MPTRLSLKNLEVDSIECVHLRKSERLINILLVLLRLHESLSYKDMLSHLVTHRANKYKPEESWTKLGYQGFSRSLSTTEYKSYFCRLKKLIMSFTRHITKTINSLKVEP